MTFRLGRRALAHVGVVFLFVACTFTYYGQLHRTQSGDVYGTIYTSVALVQKQTIWLDAYLPYLQQHSGEHPYMVTTRPSGHIVTATPTASSVLALPVVAAFTVAGARGQDWNAWMEASMLTAALTGAATVALLFVLLTRLTTRRRAAFIAVTYAWGTLAWGVSGQALWQHGGAALALTVTLLALLDRRFMLAGLAITAMAAFRLTTPVLAIFLLPLIGRRWQDWLRFLLAAAPLPLALGIYNTVAFGSPLKQGYGSSRITGAADVGSGRILDGIPGLLFSPGRGLFLYSPVLLFAIAGVILGRKQLLYRLCAISFAVYVVVVANVSQWWGGEGFGARKLAEALPLACGAAGAGRRRDRRSPEVVVGVSRSACVVRPHRAARRGRVARQLVRPARPDEDRHLVAPVRQRDRDDADHGEHRLAAAADVPDLAARPLRRRNRERLCGRAQ